MNDGELQKNLERIGLRTGEAKVYTALLKTGRSTVRTIKETTGLHRTGIYDFLEQLINRGLVTYSTEQGTKHYTPTPPEKLQNILDEQQQTLNNILPTMQQQYHKEPEDISVETGRGKEAVKALRNEIIHTGQNYICIGVDEQWWEQEFPTITAQHIKKEQEKNITWKALTVKDPAFIYNIPQATYKFMPKEQFGPLHTIIYGNNIAIITQEPLTVITIRNKTLAEAQRKHFTFLWNTAQR